MDITTIAASQQDTDIAEDILSGSAFNNALWRELTANTCRIIDQHYQVGLTVISPFGFELLEDKNYLSQRLKRFYCYIGARRPSILDKDEVVTHYRRELFSRLRALPTKMLDEIVIFIENDDLHKLRPNHYLCQATDKLIDIQFRYVEEDILTDYANYVVAALEGLFTDKGESHPYQTNIMRRWRFYQLYIMQEQLFGDLINPMSINELIAYQKLFLLVTVLWTKLSCHVS